MDFRKEIRLLLICIISLAPLLSHSQKQVNIKKGETSTTTKEKTTNNTGASSKRKNTGTTAGKSKQATPSKAANPSRTVLYTLGPNESLSYNEFSSNMRTNGTKFVAITRDNVAKKQSIILNGKKIVTGDNVYIFDINLDSSNPINYRYENGDEFYIVMDGEKYGPYEDVSFPEAPMLKTFIFKRMGRVFRRDSDGVIYPIDDTSIYNPEEIDGTYTSTNGLHKLKFKKGNHAVEYKNREYDLGISSYASNIVPQRVIIQNNNDVYLDIFYKLGDNYFVDYYTILDGNIRKYDWDSFYPIIDNVIFNAGKDNRQSFKSIYDNVEEYKDADGDWKYGLNIMLQDSSRRHILNANWKYDFVMIDDKQFNCPAPFCAFYDETTNSFSWVTQEGKQFVQYTYKL